MMNHKTLTFFVVVGALAAVRCAGCLSQNQVDIEQVRTYADPITENILVAMNEDNYTKYSEHFDAPR